MSSFSSSIFQLSYIFSSPEINKSLVVCAIDEKIEYYSNIFHEIEDIRKESDFYNKLTSKLEWKLFEDTKTWSEEDLLTPIELYRNEEDYLYCIKLLNKLKKGNYRSEEIYTGESKDKLYFVSKGKVWVSEN